MSSGAPRRASTSPVKILIADDHALIRQIVTKTLNTEPDFNVVGEAVNGLEALDMAKTLKPHVVVLDITKPVLDGFEAARRIHEELPDIAIVMLSGDIDQRLVDEAKKIGARAYVPKADASDSLVKAIHAVTRDDTFFVVFT